jgi:kinesin family protein 6/9
VVRHLRVAAACTEEDAQQHLFDASRRRTVAAHALNARSSRAHFVLTVHLAIASDEGEAVSKLHLVDLAGSERSGRTGAAGLVAREAGFINKSLSFLEQVVVALGAAATTKLAAGGDSVGTTPTHIPFRRSKLTHLLRFVPCGPRFARGGVAALVSTIRLIACHHILSMV